MVGVMVVGGVVVDGVVGVGVGLGGSADDDEDDVVAVLLGPAAGVVEADDCDSSAVGTGAELTGEE